MSVMIDTASTAWVPPAVMRVAFRLRAALAYRSVAIDLVSTLIDHMESADAAFHHEMTTAFSEAFNNVAIHGYRGRTDGMLDVEAEFSGDQMTLNLKDSGATADLASVPPPPLPALLEGGMGVFLMTAMVDGVAYRGGKQNVLSLTKRTAPSKRPEGRA